MKTEMSRTKIYIMQQKFSEREIHNGKCLLPKKQENFLMNNLTLYLKD